MSDWKPSNLIDSIDFSRTCEHLFSLKRVVSSHWSSSFPSVSLNLSMSLSLALSSDLIYVVLLSRYLSWDDTLSIDFSLMCSLCCVSFLLLFEHTLTHTLVDDEPYVLSEYMSLCIYIHERCVSRCSLELCIHIHKWIMSLLLPLVIHVHMYVSLLLNDECWCCLLIILLAFATIHIYTQTYGDERCIIWMHAFKWIYILSSIMVFLCLSGYPLCYIYIYMTICYVPSDDICVYVYKFALNDELKILSRCSLGFYIYTWVDDKSSDSSGHTCAYV